MSGINLFTPNAAGTSHIDATTSTGSVALAPLGGNQVRVKNVDATNVVFIAFGTSAITAVVATGIPLGPGDVAGFTLPGGTTHAAAITATGTASVYFTPGNGM